MESELGLLGGIHTDRTSNNEFLTVTTAVGVLCGYDESAYLYRRDDQKRWRRFWESEQNDYSENKYLPQMLHAIRVSPTNYDKGADKREHLILTLGTNPWCSSNWHPVYDRVWQTKSNHPEPKLLLDESEIAFLGRDPPIQGSVGPHDILVEYTIARGAFTRQQIHHYAVEEGKVRRVDPVALSPRDFVDEWLTRVWTESSAWTQTKSRAALKLWHARLKSGPDRLSGNFDIPTLYCKNQSDVWQVGINFESPQKPVHAYFLVRWRPPYHFTMLAISDHPKRGCNERDPEADEPRTLFPIQDWR